MHKHMHKHKHKHNHNHKPQIISPLASHRHRHYCCGMRWRTLSLWLDFSIEWHKLDGVICAQLVIHFVSSLLKNVKYKQCCQGQENTSLGAWISVKTILKTVHYKHK